MSVPWSAESALEIAYALDGVLHNEGGVEGALEFLT